MATLPEWKTAFNLASGAGSSQRGAVLQALDNGTFVAVWRVYTDDGPELWMRTFSADGTPMGPEAKIRLAAEDAAKENQTITVLKNGNILVAWQDQSILNGEKSWGVRGQIFNAGGVKIGSDLHFNSVVDGYQGSVSIAALAGGGFAVSYSDVSDPEAQTDIRTRVFDKDGNAVLRSGEAPGSRNDLIVNTVRPGVQDHSATIALHDGRYVVFYEDDKWGDDGIVARIFKADGTPASDEIEISDRANVGRGVTAATLTDGRFVAVWEDYAGGGTGSTLKARIFDAEGKPKSIELSIAGDAAAIQQDAHVVALPDGGFAVTYKNVGDKTDIRIATFTASGAPMSEAVVHASQGRQILARSHLTVLADGRLVLSWDDELITGAGQVIHAQIFDPRIGAVTLAGTSQDDHYIGSAFNDTLNGAAGSDKLEGAAGDDVLNGGAGRDTLDGGVGNDTYYVDDSGDQVIDVAGIDTVITTVSYVLSEGIENLIASGSGAIILNGNNLANAILGNEFANTLHGDDGNDTLDGAGGADYMVGGKGNDVYYVDSKSDKVIEAKSGGTDTVYARASYTLATHVEKLIGEGSGAINLTGNASSNTVTGNAGKNTIKGQGGNDIIDGGLGNDVLYGGKGKDAFVFSTALNKSKNVDKIADFNVKDDTIRLDNAIFTKLAKTGKLNKAFFKIGSKAKDKNDYIVYDSKKGVLSYDADGSGKKHGLVKFATLSKNLKMTAADFLVI